MSQKIKKFFSRSKLYINSNKGPVFISLLLVALLITTTISSSLSINTLSNTIDTLEETVSSHETLISSLGEENLELEENLEVSKESIVDLTNEIEDTKEKLEVSSTNLEKKDKEILALKSQLKKANTTPTRGAISRNITSQKTEPTKKTTNTSTNRSITMQATAYCNCSICCGKWAGGKTASGTTPRAGRTIAVDPRVIPLGSTVTIDGYGTYIAEDTGSAIKGNIIDIYFSSHSEALKFGRRTITVRL